MMSSYNSREPNTLLDEGEADMPKNLVWGPAINKDQTKRYLREQQALEKERLMNPERRYEDPQE